MKKNVRIATAIMVLSSIAGRVNANEKEKFENTEFVDASLTLKAYVGTGGTKKLLSDEVNNQVIQGIVEFDKGKISTVHGRGSFVVDGIRIGYSSGALADGAHTKNYGQTGAPSDIENAVLEIKQGSTTIRKIKIADYLLQGDEAQSPRGAIVPLASPFALVGDEVTTYILTRPADVNGAECYLDISFFGVQAKIS